MANVFLRGRSDRPDDLPDVCAKCGADAPERVKKTFNWVPQWIGITILLSPIIYIVLAMVLRKTQTVAVPLCKDHKGHWTNRILLIVGSLILVVGGSIGLAVLVSSMSRPGQDDLVGVAWLGVVGALIAWLVILIVAQSTAIRPKEITDKGINLAGVGKEFVAACEEQDDRERDARRGAMDRFDERRPSRRDDDDRPRRRGDQGVQEDEDDRPRRRRPEGVQEDEDDRPRKPRRDDY